MLTSAQVLAKFAAELTFSDIPPSVVKRAKDSIIDSVAAATFGVQFPWSRMIVEYARRYGAGGPCSIIGVADARVHAPYSALANGALITAFEQDSGRYPFAGAHAGPTLLPAVLAACQETAADGKTAITAFVAGCEVMYRIALASHHSPEKLGFHEPALTGPYGAAIAAGRVFGHNAEQLGHALGIAGSLSSGLLAYTKSKGGGMVKRLHLGRASESGILAARLADSGYAGPETVLEGKFGYLNAYGRDADPALLIAGLHEKWETSRIGMKRYALHGSAQVSVQTLRDLMAEHAFQGIDVERVIVDVSEKILSHHNISEPADIAQAQYSLPFCIALALFRDPDDPKSIAAGALDDTEIRNACRNVVQLRASRAQADHNTSNVRITVRLVDGREVTRDANSYKGMPDFPFNQDELRRKFMRLTSATDEGVAARLFDRLENLENEPRFPA